MYVCGITPYDTTHLGHAFTYTFFDTLLRYLSFRGYKVSYAQNVTDIDDDILKKAFVEKRNWRELGDEWTQKFLIDLQHLNILSPSHYIKATDSIPSIIKITQKLLKKEFAYEVEGNVYFRTKKDSNYGKLSGFKNDLMIKLSRERGGDPNDPRKEHPLDFILWQKSVENEPFWESPWGHGRPGWHIECSAMIYDHLGEQIDIHGGGEDLIYPHHESEIAQSEHFTNKKPFSRFWIHTGPVMYEGEKMSKSLGNLVMVSKLLNHYSANAIRFVLLSHHYQSAWEFFEHKLDEAEDQIQVLERILSKQTAQNQKADTSKPVINKFTEALDNNMDTPAALAVLMEYAIHADTKKPAQAIKTIHSMATLLGFKF